jgi:signal transduction histidine kinase
MTDEPHSLGAGDLGSELHGDLNPPPKLVPRWVPAERMDETWLPSYFRPQYDVLDRSLADASQTLARLGDLIQQYTPATITSRETNVRWMIQSTTNSIAISEKQQAQSVPDGSQLLPNQAIILQLTGRGSLNVEYWDSSLYPGGGAASPDLLILTTAKSIDPAWLVWEFRTNELIDLQLTRARDGAIIPRVNRNQLFGLWLPLPDSEEQARRANTVRGIIRENQSLIRAQAIIESAKRTQRVFIVTGVTIQDRLRQFEEYLLGEDWITPGSLFSIERVEGQQKFVIQRIQRGRQGSSIGSVITRRPMEIEADREWLEWSSNSDGIWKIFNSLLGKDDLPRRIMGAMVGYLSSDLTQGAGIPKSLPAFDIWRQLFRSIWDLQGTLSPSDWGQIPGIWLTQDRGDAWSSVDQRPPRTDARLQSRHSEAEESQLIEFIRHVSRPILALKAIHEGEVVRVFLILGPDQTDDPTKALALLEGYSSILAGNLNLATHFVAEAAQRESLRRLSWLRHQMEAPIGMASNALADIKAFLLNHEELASELVPSKDVANKLASRPGMELSDYTIAARLRVVERELGKLNILSERIRELSQIGEDEAMVALDVARLVVAAAEDHKDLVPGLVLRTIGVTTSIVVNGKKEQLAWVFGQVFFNACREFKEQRTLEPCLTVTINVVNGAVNIEVRDNALPTADSLPPNPFQEGVSKYRGPGGGTGRGLTMAREFVAVHGGHCSLEENRDSNGNRLSGATFKLSLPLIAEGVA